MSQPLTSSKSSSNPRPRRTRRSSSFRRAILQTCHPLSLDTVDLSPASAAQTLASLRFVVLSYLADLETRLSQLDSPVSELSLADSLKAKGEIKIEEAREWAQEALEMLKSIRADVRSHLPELQLTDISVDSFVNHLPHMPDVPRLDGIRSHLPDMHDVRSHLPDLPDVRSHLPDMPDVRSHLPEFNLAEMRSKLNGVRARFNDIDFQKPFNYIPTLSEHLQNLDSHLTSMELPTEVDVLNIKSNSMLSDLIDILLSSDVMAEIQQARKVIAEGEDMLEKAANQIAAAVKSSLQGKRLITYHELPIEWRNNPFVTNGYRFIPIEQWQLLVLSLFAFHNETLNIHTHLAPFVMWGLNMIPFFNPQGLNDGPETVFTAFALLCLLSSAVFHTMVGCAHLTGMNLCARVDYVGIGWLISASVGTVVYYGLQCHPEIRNFFLICCFLTGLSGNIFPFMGWFDQYKYRNYKIAFFLSLAFFALAPLGVIAFLHSTMETLAFMRPIAPSLASYLIGLVFYSSHIPERFISKKWARRLDMIGGGSHAIWHGFVVLAISQHKSGMRVMRESVMCRA